MQKTLSILVKAIITKKLTTGVTTVDVLNVLPRSHLTYFGPTGSLKQQEECGTTETVIH